jgi:hypothetical protein
VFGGYLPRMARGPDDQRGGDLIIRPHCLVCDAIRLSLQWVIDGTELEFRPDA